MNVLKKSNSFNFLLDEPEVAYFILLSVKFKVEIDQRWQHNNPEQGF